MLLDIMNNTSSPAHKEKQCSNLNGSVRRPSPMTIPISSGNMVGVMGRPVSLMDSPTHAHSQFLKIIINKDETGYGMKVSGDNPVYVQSVKDGGAAEKAGLHAGDKIIKVNGVNVTQSMHTEVVDLIKSSSQVVLTVQQRTGPLRNMGSPSLHARPLTTHASQRITGPQPVTHEKQYQLQLEREQQIRLMIEKEQRYIDQLRSEIAVSQNDKKNEKLSKAESNLQKLHTILQNHVRTQNEQTPRISHLFDNLNKPPPPLPNSPPPNLTAKPLPNKKLKKSLSCSFTPPNEGLSNLDNDVPPPLPKRNRPQIDGQNNKKPLYVNGKVPLDINSVLIGDDINFNTQHGVDVDSNVNNLQSDGTKVPKPEIMVDNSLYSDTSTPPPLPPRNPVSNSGISDPDAVNSINKQMSYPLVATCTPLLNNYTPNHTHHRTKSSPESLCVVSPAEASRRLIASESMSDLTRSESWEPAGTPPGTPPPPYPSPLSGRRQDHNRNSANADDVDHFDESAMDSSLDQSLLSSSSLLGRVLANSSPIHAATAQSAQQPIISMEDDEISDPEVGQLEDHGPFKSLSRLWEHTPHLAVFMNYILSNSDPNSLLFYLITDLYKEGNAKEMRKWAYEIHSTFLVPGAPLRLSNVDENIAREIDDVLTREFDKEEILRKIFWKARSKANKELTRQLEDFQQKRTAGLGTIFGPNDLILADITQDKAKEMNLYENLLLDKLDPYLRELDQENYDHKRYLMAAALATVITRIFGVRSTTRGLDRCPTFVKKETFRPKFIGKYSRKLTLQGHQFVAQPYYTVILCNHCHQIINGISPQGYQCTTCLINVHRLCVKLYDDTCPGPINKKDRGIGKFMDRIHSRDPRRKPSSHFIQMERERKMAEERDISTTDLDSTGETKPGHPVSRTGSDRRPDAVREESSRTHQENSEHVDHEADVTNQDSTVSLPAYTGNKKRVSTNINRSESVKEQSEKRKQRRNISDPLHNTTHETVDLDQHGLTYQTNSGSSSNSSLSSRSSESPSASLDAVSGFPPAHPAGSGLDSDMEVEADPPDWQSSVPQEELANLHPHDKKRQDVINELFHTERSHVRNLRVLDCVFKKPLQASKLLKPEDINLIFPNLTDLLEIHSHLNSAMKSKRKESPVVGDIGDMLLNMFDGTMGENFQSLAAAFCERQQLALAFIKEKRKNNSRFDVFLSECEKNYLCRRLPLQGILPTEMQRLSKYPLLLERLIDSEEKNKQREPELAQAELSRLKQAHDRSKEILNHVNEAAKIACNRARLKEMQKHLDTSLFEKFDHSIVNEYKNLDFTRYNLIHEGAMHLRRPDKLVALHVVLLEEAVILLQKDAERFVLKFFQSGISTQQPIVPIIKTSTLLVRENAASKSSLLLVNTSTQNSQLVDLLARDKPERDIWLKHISDVVEAYHSREGKSKRSDPTPDVDEIETLQDLPTVLDATERAEHVGGGGEVNSGSETESGGPSGESSNRNSDIMEAEKRLSQSDGEPAVANEISGGGVTMRLTADDWPLVQPTEVHVAVPPVHTAEPVLTPLEQIKRKDEEVRRALADKEDLVADLLSIPREEYKLIADMASEVTNNKSYSDKEPAELVLAAVFQTDQLLAVVNESLNISEADAILATGGRHSSCASNENAVSQQQNNHLPSVPCHKLQDIATTLSTQLTTLLSLVKQRDEERDRLRRELQRTRELHDKLVAERSQNVEVDYSTLDQTQSSDLESIQESLTENDNN